MTNPITAAVCTCPGAGCPLHRLPTYVHDDRERALLDSLDAALAACRNTRAPAAVYAALFAGTSLAIELGEA